MSNWRPVTAPDQSGRAAVVTGANSGLGYEITKGLTGLGAEVVMACRSTDRGERARREIEAAVADANLTVAELDLASLSSIASFADWFNGEYDALNLLVNNAGIMAIPRSETADGFETQFGVNHLGHFALTGHLLESLRAAEAPRVGTMSSYAHTQGEMNFEDLHGETDYDAWGAYGQSKLANLLFAYELDRRTEEVLSVAAHPGYAATNLQYVGPEQSGNRLRKALMQVANAVIAQDAADGALPMLYAMTMREAAGGEYYGPGGFRKMRGSPERQRSSEQSYNLEDAQRLWDVSEELTGVQYPPEAS